MGLEELFSQTRRGGPGCYICGEPNAARLILSLRQYTSGKGDGSGTASHSHTLCEAHALEVWPKMEATFIGLFEKRGR